MSSRFSAVGACLYLVAISAGLFLVPTTVEAQPAQRPAAAGVLALQVGLAQRALWGRSYNVLIASLPAWARIKERTIVVAPDVIFGGTPYRTREEAEGHAKALATALREPPSRLQSVFASVAAEGRTIAADSVGVRPYGGGESYRVVVGYGLNPLAQDLRIEQVRQALGREQTVKREVDPGGERRPLVFTGYVYANGAMIFQTSNFAATDDQVVRAVLDVAGSLQAMGGTP